MPTWLVKFNNRASPKQNTLALKMSSVRENCPWFQLELKLHEVDNKWEYLIDLGREFYAMMDDELYPTLEKKCNSKLIVSGPLVHTYIKEICSLMLNKLNRGKITGVQSASPVLIPWQVMVNLMYLLRGYGATVKTQQKKAKEKIFTVIVPSKICGRKIWSIKRCKKNFLSRKKYQSNETGMYEYSGRSAIVITERTPVVITYNRGKQKAGLSFYIQRYNNQDLTVDAMLQARINGE